jgi:hypothetical protein
MRFISLRIVSLAAMLSFQPIQPDALAWHDKTHLTIAEAAGFDLWYSASAPDVAKSKSEFGAVESPNHYFNNNANHEVTPAMVLGQVSSYDRPGEGEGHLYGAIIGSVRAFRSMKATGKYARYPLVFCAHYIGDLSMPLHNTPYDDFNKARHSINDGTIESSVRNNIGYIQRKLTPISINSESDLAREVSAVAESGRQLGLKMRKENRDMTVDEAYIQVIRSASLFRAVLAFADNESSGK